MKTRGILLYCDGFQGDTKEALEACIAAASAIHKQQELQIKNDIPRAKRELKRKKGIVLSDEEIEKFKREGAYQIKIVTVDV